MIWKSSIEKKTSKGDTTRKQTGGEDPSPDYPEPTVIPV